MKVVKVLRAHVGVAAVSAAVILGGAGAATAMVATSSDVPAVEEPAATTTTATPTPAPAPVPVAVAPAPEASTAAQAPSAGSVEIVTSAPRVESQPVDAAAVEEAGASSYDPAAPWVDSSGTTYVPAPDLPIDLLPGEPGYVPPAD